MAEDPRGFPDHIAITIGTLWRVACFVGACIGFAVLCSWWFYGNVTEAIDHVGIRVETMEKGQDRLERKIDDNHEEVARHEEIMQHQMSDLRSQFMEIFIARTAPGVPAPEEPVPYRRH